MSLTVCLAANALPYLEGGGHLWVYLNWALGLRALGCRVLWLEGVDPALPRPTVQARVATLQQYLKPYGLADCVALCSRTEAALGGQPVAGCLDVEAAAEADVFLNLLYSMPAHVVQRFRRSALLDIDPGLLQIWISQGRLTVQPHDVYFTIGETVGRAGARFPDLGLQWQFTPPCVALDWWPWQSAPAGASFTTVSHWYTEEWLEEGGALYPNDKRHGFLPFLDLPQHTAQPLELALCMLEDDDEWAVLRAKGWQARHAWDVSATPWDYQRYVQHSLGEFSCVKPSCVRLQNAWISDRTLCYLASGKPAVVQHTGPSHLLPEAAGLFRFSTLHDAVRCLEAVGQDYEHQCRLARALAEEHFDARHVVRRVLEQVLA
jgi:hypothetical protein